MQEESGAEPDSEIMRALKSLGLHNTNNNIDEVNKNIDEVREDIKADLHKLEGWVLNLIDDLNGRVTEGFSAHQDMIDEVEDKVDEIQRSQKEFKGEVNKDVQENTNDIEALKKAIEDLRNITEWGLDPAGGEDVPDGGRQRISKKTKDRRMELVRSSDRVQNLLG